MEASYKSFQRRQRKIERSHRKLAKGYTTRLNPETGNYEHAPNSEFARHMISPLIALTLGFFCFKAFLLVRLGTEDYAGHLAALENGSLSEQMGAVLMSLDPLTVTLADLASRVI
ncbi:hypothetical protein [Litorisediminicola beolgyonensis]|uniref:Uncharacterized protein n=1 Tax=Litorisediminicola beolgyonensis TaxID=1173614 RepID=A0ABW3ZNJ5_9RHOB